MLKWARSWVCLCAKRSYAVSEVCVWVYSDCYVERMTLILFANFTCSFANYGLVDWFAFYIWFRHSLPFGNWNALLFLLCRRRRFISSKNEQKKKTLLVFHNQISHTKTLKIAHVVIWFFPWMPCEIAMNKKKLVSYLWLVFYSLWVEIWRFFVFHRHVNTEHTHAQTKKYSFSFSTVKFIFFMNITHAVNRAKKR